MSLLFHRGWRCILFFVVAAATIYFLYRVREVLYAFGFGGVTAYILYRPVKALENKGLKRVQAIVVIYTLSLACLGVLSYWMVPAAVAELGDLKNIYPLCVEDIQRLLTQMDGMPKPERLQIFIDDNLLRLEAGIYNALQNFIDTWYHLLSRLLALIFAPILAFYILCDWEKISDAVLNLLPPGSRMQVRTLYQQVDRIMVEFIKGYFLIAVTVGLLTGVWAALLGVPFPLVIGVVAGITNLVPYFGPILGGLPAIALAWTVSLRLAALMAAGILIIQQLDANLFTPRIIGRKLGMHPLTVIFALLAGGTLFGLWGIILALPAAAVLKVVLRWAHLKIVG